MLLPSSDAVCGAHRPALAAEWGGDAQWGAVSGRCWLLRSLVAAVLAPRLWALLLTPPDYQGAQAAAAKRQHARWRQVVETMNGHLIRSFGLHFPGARSKQGLLARIAAKLTAMNVGYWLNHLFGRPLLAFATLFPA